MQFGQSRSHLWFALAAAGSLIAIAGGAVSGIAETTTMMPTATIESCTSCHGPGGQSQGEMPTLAGRDAEELVSLLTAYRDGDLSGSIMDRLTGPLGDNDILLIADYFSKL